MSVTSYRSNVLRILRMWEFWLNYAIILVVVLPIPVLNMSYSVSIDGEVVSQHTQSRTVYECYKFAWIEGWENPAHFGVIAAHWFGPFLLTLLIWSLIVRRRNSSDEDDSNTFRDILDDVRDLLE